MLRAWLTAWHCVELRDQGEGWHAAPYSAVTLVRSIHALAQPTRCCGSAETIPLTTDGCEPSSFAVIDPVLQVQAQVALDTAVVCTCAHGRRGGEAASKLARSGFKQVVNLEGGLAAWADKQLPHNGSIQRHH
jgi:hypothetical protein